MNQVSILARVAKQFHLPELDLVVTPNSSEGSELSRLHMVNSELGVYGRITLRRNRVILITLEIEGTGKVLDLYPNNKREIAAAVLPFITFCAQLGIGGAHMVARKYKIVGLL